MPIGDWIREANEKRRQRILEQGRTEGRTEGYRLGYDDAEKGKPRQVPGSRPDSDA